MLFTLFVKCIEQKMGTIMKQRLNQHEKFIIEDDDDDDEDENDGGALIFENAQYATRTLLFIL